MWTQDRLFGKQYQQPFLFHTYETKGIFSWMENIGTKLGQACINILLMTELQGKVCNFVLVFSYLTNSQRAKHKITKVKARCQEHYRGPASVWCSRKALKLGGNFAAPAVTVGQEYWSHMDLLYRECGEVLQLVKQSWMFLWWLCVCLQQMLKISWFRIHGR